MKTTEKKLKIPKSLEEVWQWKEQVFEETKDKSFVELKKIYFNSLKKAAEFIGAKLVQNADGTYSLA